MGLRDLWVVILIPVVFVLGSCSTTGKNLQSDQAGLNRDLANSDIKSQDYLKDLDAESKKVEEVLQRHNNSSHWSDFLNEADLVFLKSIQPHRASLSKVEEQHLAEITKRVNEGDSSGKDKDDFSTSEEKELLGEFQSRFEVLKDYFHRAYYWLSEFDKSIASKESYTSNESGDVTNFENPAYIQLLLSWGEQERIIHEMASIYKRSLEYYLGFGGAGKPGASRLRFAVFASRLVKRVQNFMETWNRDFPLVHNRYWSEFHLIHLEMKDRIRTAMAADPSMREFYQLRSLIDRRTRWAEKLGDGLTQVDSMTSNHIQELQDQAGEIGRDPQNLKNFRIIQDQEEKAVQEVSSWKTLLRGIEPNPKPEQREVAEATQTATLNTPESISCIEPTQMANGNLTGLELKPDEWILTFDDGPSPITTPGFIRYLSDEGVTANFFMLAQNMQKHKAIVLDIEKDKHLIASHSWSHANLPKLSDKELDREIIEPNKVHQDILGKAPVFFRCPYGAGYKNPRIRERIVAQKMIHVLWNVDTLDWQDKNPVTIVQRALKQMSKQKRGIVLFHDIHKQSLIASHNLVKKLKVEKKGIHWLTLNKAKELLDSRRENCKKDPAH